LSLALFKLLIGLRREPEHISIRIDRRADFPAPGFFREGILVKAIWFRRFAVFRLFLSRSGRGGPGTRNAAMLSDVDVAVTSQTGVLDLPFVESGAAGRWIPREWRKSAPSTSTD
jgi:hypothetical protein